MKLLLVFALAITLSSITFAKDHHKEKPNHHHKDEKLMTKASNLRKAIVFDKNTPDVFYCPIHKPTGIDKMIVKARPLKKLCEFEGQPIPEDYKSDCYQDIDESSYACKEKYRIMKRYANEQN